MCSAEGAGRAFSVVEKPQGKSFTDFLQLFCEGAVNSLCMPSSGHTFCRVTMEKRCRLQVKMSLICWSLSLSFWISTNYTVYIIPVIQSCVCCRIVFAPLLEFLTFQQLPELVLSCQAFHVLETAVDSGDCWLNFRSTSGQCLWVESARCNCPMAPAGVRGISTEPRSKASTR